MSVFTDRELEFLHGTRRLGRIATVGRDGTPHVTPVGWQHNVEHDTIDVGGHDVAATKKFRDVSVSGRAAIVIDDVVSTNPWRPRAIEVRGRAEAVGDPHALSRITQSGSGHGASSQPANHEPCRPRRSAVSLVSCVLYQLIAAVVRLARTPADMRPGQFHQSETALRHVVTTAWTLR